MTDKELIQAYRECSRHPRCEGCPMDTTEREKDCPVSWFDLDDMVNRMEALLAENEHLREATKMMPKWRPASKPPKATGDYLVDMLAYLGGVKRHQEVLHFTTARKPFIPEGSWYKIDDFGYPEIVRAKDIISWMPLPSTEGVE